MKPVTGTLTEGEISKLFMNFIVRINSHLNSKSTNNKIIIHIELTIK